MFILNLVLLLYAIPLLICYIGTRYLYNIGEDIGVFEIMMILIPIVNWISLLAIIIFCTDDWVHRNPEKLKNFVKQFLRVK